MEEFDLPKCRKLEITCFSGNNISGDQSALKLNKQPKMMVRNGDQEASKGIVLDLRGNINWNSW